VVLVPYWRCNSRKVFYSAVVNRTVVAWACFILEAAWLIVFLAQFWAVPRNVLKRATWLWLNQVTTSVDILLENNILENQNTTVSKSKNNNFKTFRLLCLPKKYLIEVSLSLNTTRINQAIEIHLFDWNNEVFVIITTTLTEFTYATLNLFEIYFQKSEPHCE